MRMLGVSTEHAQYYCLGMLGECLASSEHFLDFDGDTLTFSHRNGFLFLLTPCVQRASFRWMDFGYAHGFCCSGVAVGRVVIFRVVFVNVYSGSMP